MRTNQAGIDLIKEFEGLRLEAYKCPSKIWTQGYGTTGAKVRPGTSISQATAEQWLAENLQEFEQAVQKLVKVPLNENQFSALVSFAYNCGATALANSTALKRLNAGDYEGCVEALQYWVKGASNQVLPGLARRRKAEGELFSLAPTPAVPNNTKPVMKSSPQNLPNSFLLNSYRYFKDLPHQQQAIAYLEQHVPAYALQEMQRIWRTEAKELGLPTVSEQLPVANAQPKQAKASVSKPKTLVDRIVAYMDLKGYEVYKAPGKRNIVYVEGMNPDGTLNDDRPNWFNDIRCVFEYKNGKPSMIAVFQGSSEPGAHFTHRPMNPSGCARIAFGQYRAWRVGFHGSRPYEALVQRANVTIHRDLNKDFKRVGDRTYTGDNYGLNQHHAYNAAENNLSVHSAGCLVGRTVEGHQQFMKIIKADPDYVKNKNYLFATTVIPGDEMMRLIS